VPPRQPSVDARNVGVSDGAAYWAGAISPVLTSAQGRLGDIASPSIAPEQPADGAAVIERHAPSPRRPSRPSFASRPSQPGEHRPGLCVQIGLGERERFADPARYRIAVSPRVKSPYGAGPAWRITKVISPWRGFIFLEWTGLHFGPARGLSRRPSLPTSRCGSQGARATATQTGVRSVGGAHARRAMQCYIGSAQHWPLALTERAAAPRVPHPASWESALSVAARPGSTCCEGATSTDRCDAASFGDVVGKALPYLLIGWVNGGAFRHC
jgi:hypothetical protein